VVLKLVLGALRGHLNNYDYPRKPNSNIYLPFEHKMLRDGRGY
jgi:hypothetical protein